MTTDFSYWMRAVWESLADPSRMAMKVKATRMESGQLWSALFLIAILNVLFLAAMQYISPLPEEFSENMLVLSPFSMTVLMMLSFSLLVYSVFYVGRAMGGAGDLHQTLTVLVWFHAVNLTLEAMQIVLSLVSPFLSALSSLVIFAGLIWCILNFIDVLHEFGSLLRSLATLIIALVAMALVAVTFMAMFGLTPERPA